LNWSAQAQHSYSHTLEYIGSQDSHAADLVAQRVSKALAILLFQPEIGTVADRRGLRRFAIPNTGHVIDYRVVKNELRIIRWARQARKQRSR